MYTPKEFELNMVHMLKNKLPIMLSRVYKRNLMNIFFFE